MSDSSDSGVNLESGMISLSTTAVVDQPDPALTIVDLTRPQDSPPSCPQGSPPSPALTIVDLTRPLDTPPSRPQDSPPSCPQDSPPSPALTIVDLTLPQDSPPSPTEVVFPPLQDLPPSPHPIEVEPSTITIGPIPTEEESSTITVEPITVEVQLEPSPMMVGPTSVELEPSPSTVGPTPVEVEPTHIKFEATPTMNEPTSSTGEPLHIDVDPPGSPSKMRQRVKKSVTSRSETKIIDEDTQAANIKGGWESGVLFRWQKSLWKRVWKQLLTYTIVYLVISFIYRVTLPEHYQNIFENIVKHFKDNSQGVPLTFIQGLYIGLVVRRWWDQYTSLPLPDDTALHLSACIIGRGDKAERARLFRRTVIRYCLVSYILALRRQSSRLRARFPSMTNLVEAGLLREDEKEKLKEEDVGEMYTSRWWVPLRWSMEVLANASYEGLVVVDGYVLLVAQIDVFKRGLQRVKAYGNLPVPLVYSQVVTLAVYVYFGVALIGDQYLLVDPVDMVYPLFLTFKFLFYFGLLSVASSIYNPWGTDEEDFQLNKLLARHLKVAMGIVDDNTEPAPEMQKDVFWDITNPRLLDELDKKELLEAKHERAHHSDLEMTDPGYNLSKQKGHGGSQAVRII